MIQVFSSRKTQRLDLGRQIRLGRAMKGRPISPLGNSVWAAFPGCAGSLPAPADQSGAAGNSTSPITASKDSAWIMPGRNRRGRAAARSSTVDSRPTCDGPPSTMRGI